MASGPTNFFEHQEAARRGTGRLVVLFLLAVLAIILSVYVVVAFLYGRGSGAAALWNPGLFATVTLGVSALVAGGSAYRTASLAGGGQHVAELLGGRLLDPRTRDPDERRLLNVVEEMAIAAGCPVPPVYLMDQEEAINAFAAGDDPNNAVIGVTRGTLELLSRDELQGVIAHEFSHILNGDMRLNVRLMGLLFGLLLIGVTGWTIFRNTQFMAMRYRTRDGDRRDGVNPLPILGLALCVLGYVGVFFGRLIKAGVSRQREYLADASAAQFTRNPSGLADALKKIGAFEDGSRIQNPHAEEASHLFFGEGLGLMPGSWLSTHPPIAERIRRLDPSFDGDFGRVALNRPRSMLSEEQEHWRQMTEAKIGDGRPPRSPIDHDSIPFSPLAAVESVGTIHPDGLKNAANLLEGVPYPIAEALHDPFGACAVVYALLLDRENDELHQAQRQLVRDGMPEVVSQHLENVAEPVAALGPEWRFPLVELAIPALRRLNRIRFQEFVEVLRHLMEVDRRITLFEYALRRMLMRTLGPYFQWGVRPPETIDHWQPLVESATIVFNALAHAGGANDSRATQAAYAQGIAALGWPAAFPPLAPAEAVSLSDLDLALNTLACARMRWKKPFLLACAATIEHDGQVTIEEGELLRATADALDCPMPPLSDVPARR